MNTYHAAFWSSDPSRLSSSDEEEDDRDTEVMTKESLFEFCKSMLLYCSCVAVIEYWILEQLETY